MSRGDGIRQLSDSPPEHFEIRVYGHLGSSWSDYFGGLRVENNPGGETILAGPVADQAELHGILASVRDLNLELISVNRIESDYSPDKE